MADTHESNNTLPQHYFWTCPECQEQVVRLSEAAIDVSQHVHEFRHRTDRAVKPTMATVVSSLYHVTVEDRIFLKSCGIKED